MTRTQKLHIAGKTAIIAALLSGSSMSFAQDAAPVVAAPTQAPPVQQATAPVATTPTVTPPPAVRTLPGENDRVNAAAAEEAAAEAAERREAVTATRPPARPRVVPRAAPVAETTATPVTDAVAPDADVASSAVVAAPAVDQIVPVGATVEETAPVPSADRPVTVDGGISNEDLTLFGGLAAALAAIGLGAAFARRRRRAANDNVAYAAAPVADNAAPRPIKDDPVFQQFATRTAPERLIAPAPAIQRPKVMTRPDLPITDPLFSREIVAPPVTDPMFAPRNEVEPPITDPLFARHDRFAGRTRLIETATTRTPELVN